jgi:hypothetical protein
MSKKINEKARDLFKYEYNLTYKNISSRELYKLHQLLSSELEKHELKEHWIKILPIKIQKNTISFNNDGNIKYAFLHCKGSWFDKREAISFNQNGFIGFAGWADDTNIIPFVEAFKKWLKWIKES